VLPNVGLMRGYRMQLRTIVASSSAPYGFSLAFWASGAIVADAHGMPTALQAALHVFGAVIAFGVVGALAFGGLHFGMTEVRATPSAAWGYLHFASVGAVVVVAMLLAPAFEAGVAWPVTGFATTATYLCVVACQILIVERARRT
jgi:uncharacterized membrane protein YeaQ/YmgE (transglycosylase-associated protein family)